jgi:hypothetical protein
MTQRAEVRFAVKEYESGRLWIAAETGMIPGVDGVIGFDMVPDLTIEHAEEIAMFLNHHVHFLSLNRLGA